MRSDELFREQDISVVAQLALDYKEDLLYLKTIDLLVKSQIDLQRLKILCEKHHVNADVTKEQFPSIVGNLSGVILAKFERLVIEDVLEKYREVKSGRLPRVAVQAAEKSTVGEW